MLKVLLGNGSVPSPSERGWGEVIQAGKEFDYFCRTTIILYTISDILYTIWMALLKLDLNLNPIKFKMTICE